MSEQLQTQMPAVDAEQAAHVAAHNQQTTGTGWPEASALTAQPAETVLPEQTALNPDRASVRLANRFANFMSGKRTTKQVAGEVASRTSEFVGDTSEAAKAAAKRGAIKVGTAAILGLNSGLEAAGEVQARGKDKIAEMRAASQSRKEARQAKRDEKNMLKDAHGMNKEFDKYTKAEAKQAKREELGMLKEAHSMNKERDNKVKMYAEMYKKQDRQAKRAEIRADVAEKTKKVARVAGGAAVLAAVGTGYAAYKTGEAAYKGAKKTVEVIGDAGDATVIKVRRGQQAAAEAILNARVTRLDSKYTKAEAKSKKYQSKIKKIVNS